MSTLYNHYIGFTDKDDDFIRRNWKLASDETLARVLNRTPASVKNRRWFLKLSRIKPKVIKTTRLDATLSRMQDLIQVCESEASKYTKDKAKAELIKLSKL